MSSRAMAIEAELKVKKLISIYGKQTILAAFVTTQHQSLLTKRPGRPLAYSPEDRMELWLAIELGTRATGMVINEFCQWTKFCFLRGKSGREGRVIRGEALRALYYRSVAFMKGGRAGPKSLGGNKEATEEAAIEDVWRKELQFRIMLRNRVQ